MEGSGGRGGGRLSLAALGFDELTECVYWTLLRSPALAVTGLARELGRAESEIEAAAATLLAAGFLSQGGGGPPRPVPPGLAVDAFAARERMRLAARERELEELRLRVPDITRAYWSGEEERLPTSVFQVVRGLAEIRRMLAAVGSAASTEILRISLSPETVGDDYTQAAMALDRDRDTRGVKQRTLYPPSIVEGQPMWDYAKSRAAMGEPARMHNDLPTRLEIVDRCIACIPVEDRELDRGLLIRAPSVVTTLVRLFEMLWDQATPLFDHVTPMMTPVARPSDAVESTLISLLAAGANDEAIALHTGMSLRTVRRRIAELMEQCNARTRFEAGYRTGLAWRGRHDLAEQAGVRPQPHSSRDR